MEGLGGEVPQKLERNVYHFHILSVMVTALRTISPKLWNNAHSRLPSILIAAVFSTLHPNPFPH